MRSLITSTASTLRKLTEDRLDDNPNGLWKIFPIVIVKNALSVTRPTFPFYFFLGQIICLQSLQCPLSQKMKSNPTPQHAEEIIITSTKYLRYGT